MRSNCSMLVCLALTAAAAGQSPVAVTSEPVEEQVGDISPLRISLHRVEAGLGQPNDFDQVFRYGDGFLRAQGGLYAVFGNSVYARDKKHEGRIVPVVPAGTMFYIGAPPELAAPEPPAPRPDRIDGRVNTKVASAVTSGPIDGIAPQRDVPAAAPPAAPAPEARAILSDPEYRAKRLRRLMQHAQERALSAAAETDQAAVGRSSSSSPK